MRLLPKLYESNERGSTKRDGEGFESTPTEHLGVANDGTVVSLDLPTQLDPTNSSGRSKRPERD